MSDVAQEPSSGPTLAFEALLSQLIDQAETMQRSHSRLRDLIRVNNDLTSNLDLPMVLRRIVELGLELLDARYGAMGVVGDETRLDQFIHVGMDPGTVEAIGDLPQGRGLLGALIDDPVPVRLTRIADDRRSSGFPGEHPPMNSFLGVPIRVRDKVFGNLYLTDSRAGSFTADDEEIAQSLAATAGIAIENARLFEDSAYRARWSTALAETSRRLMRDDEGDDVSGLMVRLSELAEASVIAILVVEGDELVVHHVHGTLPGVEAALDRRFSIQDSVAFALLESGDPLTVASLAEVYDLSDSSRLGPCMMLPFAVSDHEHGVLFLGRPPEASAFADRDVEMGVSFAGHISLAMEREESRENRQRMELLEERTRIARDLHDHVIQRLFAIGLNLQSISTRLDPALAARVSNQIDEVDGAIAQIRQSIFSLKRTPEDADSLRSRIIEVVERIDPQLPGRARLEFNGPVDTLADGPLAEDVVAVVTEALSNVVRHAGASAARVVVTVAGGRLSIECTDDGSGPPARAPHRSG
ncbi:MAG: GAF domain-containing protein, partial [Actinomycetales bacterium]